MTPDGTRQYILTSLILGIQFDEFDYRLFLRDYHRDLRQRFPFEGFPAYSPTLVLDALMHRVEPECTYAHPGGRYEALRTFCKRHHRLSLCLSGSDYGALEQRASPYSFDRAAYHFGRELTSATIAAEYPGHNPYRSTRKLHIPFMRDNLSHVVELLPDYLWWSIHDQRDMLHNVLAPEKLHEVRRLIELAGYKLDSFGLYLTTFEALVMPEEEFFGEEST